MPLRGGVEPALSWPGDGTLVAAQGQAAGSPSRRTPGGVSASQSLRTRGHLGN